MKIFQILLGNDLTIEVSVENADDLITLTATLDEVLSHAEVSTKIIERA
jgi:hypothetical protein